MPNLQFAGISGRFCRPVIFLAILGGLGLGLGAEDSVETAPTAPIRFIDEFWDLPLAGRAQGVEIDLELEVLFYDPEWRVLQVRQGDVVEYIEPETEAEIHSGDLVRVVGRTVPPGDTLLIGEAEWTVLGSVDIGGTAIDLDTADHAYWADRAVVLTGLVESERLLDATHLQVNLIVDGKYVSVWVMVEAEVPLPLHAGELVKVSGVYAPKLSAEGAWQAFEVFCPGIDLIEHLGSLRDAAEFTRPLVAIRNLAAGQTGPAVTVAGRRVAGPEGPGFWLRDETGQIFVETAQKNLPEIGDGVEVTGQSVNQGIDRKLALALWRAPATALSAPSNHWNHQTLHRLTATVKDLPPPEAAMGHAVQINGVVTWSEPSSRRVFVQDTSGGIEVDWSGMEGPVPAAGRLITLDGESMMGEFTPMVRVKKIKDRGPVPYPRAETISWEQAMLGVAEAQWVGISGFIYAVDPQVNGTVLHLSSTAGELQVRLPVSESMAGLIGSVVSVSGVCVADTNADRRLERVELWVPSADVIEVLDSGNDEHFSLPISPLSELDRYVPGRVFGERIRTEGVVLHWDRTGRLFVGDGDIVMEIHSRQMTPLERGDQVSLVGFLGHEKSRTILREAIYRRHDRNQPTAIRNFGLGDDLAGIDDGTLCAIEGLLIDTIQLEQETRLVLRNGSQLFLAVLTEDWHQGHREMPAEGTRVRVTGVGVGEYNDSGQRVGLRLLVGHDADIQALVFPTWWTSERITIVVALLIGLIVLSLAWVISLRQRVERQTNQLKQQMLRAAELEADLQRTSRMESLGSMAEGIAHDFRSLLDRIKEQTGRVLESERLSGVGRETLDQARAAVLRAQDLTQRLASLSLARTPELEPLDFIAFMRREVEAFEIGPAVKIDWYLPDKLPLISVDRAQFRQVVRHLLLNAAQAMPDGGNIRIELEEIQLESNHESDVLASGTYLRLMVQDSGEGIALANLNRVFDPYFSTRQRAKGLGLSVVYAITRQHRGHVKVESSPMAGTEVTLWLRMGLGGHSPSS